MAVGKGLGSIRDSAGGSLEYIKMKSGEAKVIRIVLADDEIPTVWEHTDKMGEQWKTFSCLGKSTCPLCKAGKKASFKAYIPVIDRGDGKVKIFKASMTVVKDLLGFVDEYGCLTKRDYKVSRQGEKLDTKYQFFPKDEKVEDFSEIEIPDINDKIQPLTVEAMTELIGGTKAPATGDDQYPF